LLFKKHVKKNYENLLTKINAHSVLFIFFQKSNLVTKLRALRLILILFFNKLKMSNNDLKEIIKKRINKNEAVCDLSSIELNEDSLKYILKKLPNNTNIGKIKWKKEEIINQNIKDLINKIENILIINNQNYRTFPTDYIHCLLCSHCNQTEFNSDFRENANLFDKYKLLEEKGWKVKEVFQETGYKSVLYINKQTKHLVLAFQGIKLKIKDFFLQDNNIIGSTVYSMIANKEIAPQTVYSYIHTKLTVDLCKQERKFYSLSFTGHGFGAWLAEQAIYFSMKEFSFKGFEFDNVKAVTFDSPGSFEYLKQLNSSNIYDKKKLFDLSDLNIVTYLSAPNFMNTCNKHIGKVYRVFSTESKNNKINTNKVITDMIESIPNKTIKKKIKNCYDDNLKNTVNKLTFHLNGFISLFDDGLKLILNEFDINEGKPLKYKEMNDWPKFEFTPSDNFKNNFQNIFDFQHVIDSVPDGGLIPDKAKQLVRKGINFIVNKAVTFISDKLLNGLTVIINFMIEIINGNLETNQFEYNDNLDEYNNGESQVCDTNDFNLKYLGHYRIINVNLNKDILLHTNQGSIDQFLFNLFYYSNKYNKYNNDFIEKQISKLRSLYKLDTEMNKTIILSDSTQIELIKFQLDRLLKLDTNLEKFLRELISSKNNSNDLVRLESVEVDAPDLYFTGRSKELEKIDELFKTNQYIYVCGRSGYGKTQLALQYASNIKEKSNQIIIWIKNVSLVNSFRALAEQLKIENHENLEFSKLIELIKPRINKNIKDYNLNVNFFIDNLIYDEQNESLNDFQYLIFGFDFDIKFLITTKDQTIINKLNKKQKSYLFALGAFSENVCLEYINRKLNENHKRKIKKENWINIFELMSSKEERQILPIHLDKLIAKLNAPTNKFWGFNQLKIYLENEMENSFYLLKQEKPKAFETLCYFAFLNEDTISLNLIHELIIDKNLNDKQLEIKENELSENLDYLIQNSEILINFNGDYSIHETTQLEILKTFNKDAKKETFYLNKIVEILDELIDYEKIEKNKKRIDKELEELFSHSIKISKLQWKKNEKVHFISLLDKIAKIYECTLIKYDTALDYYYKSLKIRIESLQPNHPDIATSYNNIGLIYNNKGEYDTALDNYNKSLKICQECLTPNHPNIATSYNNIGLIYDSKGEYDTALDYYNKSLKIYQESLPANHPDIAISYNNIGLIYNNKGEYDTALDYFNKTLNINQESLPPNHPVIAPSYNNIGLIYDSKGEYDTALDYYNKSLNIYQESLPANHPDIAISYNNIGLIYNNKGEYDTALDYFNKTLNINQESLPPNHPNIATSYSNIGLIYKNKGEYDTALDYFYKSLKIRIESLAPNHSDIATSYNNIGLIYNNKGEYDKALDYYNKSLKIRIESLRPNHPDIATSYNNIGLIYNNKEKYDTALDYYNKSLNICQEFLTPNHPNIATSYNNIGSIYNRKGEYDTALDYYNNSLKIKIESLPPNHPDIATSYNNIGLIYNNKGEYDKALDYYNKSLNIYQESLPPNHPNIATSYNNIGSIYNRKGEKDTALDYYYKSLKIDIESLSANHSDIATSYSRIGSIYYSKVEYDTALDYYNKSLNIYKESLPPNHPNIATSYNQISNIYFKKNDNQNALYFYRLCKNISEERNETLQMAFSYNKIGLLYSNLYQYQDALNNLEEALKIFNEKSSYQEISKSYNNIGAIYLNISDFNNSLDFILKGLELQKAIMPINNEFISIFYNNLAVLYARQNDYDKALDSQNKALNMHKTFNSLVYATFYNNFGFIYYNMVKIIDSIENYKKSLDILIKIFPSGHINIDIINNKLNKIYNQMGETQNANNFIVKSLNIPDNHSNISSSDYNLGLLHLC
jgi:tetratricopeptide (TPR) repeat protein